MYDSNPLAKDWAEQYLEVVDDLVIAAHSSTGTILRTNDAARARLESVNATLAGSYVVKLVHPDDRQVVADALAELTTESPECQMTLRLNDPDKPTYSTFSVYMRLVPDADEILVINREITELSISKDEAAYSRRFIELIDDVIVVTTLGGVVVDCNPAASVVHGEDLESFRGRQITDFIHPDWQEAWLAIPDLIVEGNGRARYTMGGLRPDGSAILFDCTTVVDWERGLAYTIERDVTDSELQKQRLEVADRFFTITNDLLIRVDNENRILTCNAAFADFAGAPLEELTGQSLLQYLSGSTGRFSDALTSETTRPDSGSDGRQDLVVYSVKTEPQRAFSVSLQRGRSAESVYVAARDVTDERKLTAELRSLAETDALTGLANRSNFEKRLQAELDAGRDVAIGFIDLDRFKKVNDDLGHATGDELLKQVANRLLDSVRPTDVVSRFGGDEFCVMLTNHSPDDSVDPLARVIREVVSEPMLIDGRRVATSCSVGIALSTPDVRQAAELMKRGDAAAYAAKHAGRNHSVMFDDALDQALTSRFDLEEELRLGIEAGELDLDVQGIFTIDRELAAVKALPRWDHPTRGRLGPEEFLDAAESANLMPAINDDLLNRAFQQISPRLQASDTVDLALDLSPNRLTNPTMVEHLCDTSRSYGLDPSRIILEITEKLLVEDIDRSAANLHRLQAEGFQLAMNDFTTGANSLTHLRDHPFTSLKIGAQFIDGVENDGANTAIVESIIALASRLKISAVAEGVETEEQFEALVGIGCPRLQGSYLHRPEAVANALILTQLIPDVA